MHTHAILLPTRVGKDELRQFVEAEGGQWQDEPPFPQGLFEEGASTVLFIRSGPGAEDLASFTPEELAVAEQACGAKIISYLTADRSPGTEGGALARRVIGKLLARWGGYEMDCG